jgi:hypothetical protein
MHHEWFLCNYKFIYYHELGLCVLCELLNQSQSQDVIFLAYLKLIV